MKIILCKGKGFISRLIRWQTRSEYSHAAILVANTVYESKEGKGIVITPVSEWTYSNFEVFTIKSFDELLGNRQHAVKLALVDFLEKQRGKKYDWSSIFRFVSRRQASRKSAGVWFCSELVFAAVRKAYLPLLQRIEPWAVSPALLSLSPELVPEPDLKSLGFVVESK